MKKRDSLGSDRSCILSQAAVDQLIKIIMFYTKKYKSWLIGWSVKEENRDVNCEKLRLKTKSLSAAQKHTAIMLQHCILRCVDPVGLWPNDSQRLSFINLIITPPFKVYITIRPLNFF